jgi:hypothetical protein
MRESSSWQDILRSNHWGDSFLTGDDFAAFIEAETAINTEILRALGFEPAGGYAAVGPWVFPWIIGVLSAISALGLVATRGRGAAKEAMQWRPLAGTAILLAAYFLLIEPAGYFMATAAFFVAQARLLGSRSWRRDLLLGVALAASIYGVFTFLLQKTLPAGVFG